MYHTHHSALNVRGWAALGRSADQVGERRLRSPAGGSPPAKNPQMISAPARHCRLATGIRG
ncbi:hypothetical protein AGMMS50293_03680 [Spirochaetia bacterium]|nr:hypothetical protein AGMMS50293_03680 [Spirochaetia bacterium]